MKNGKSNSRRRFLQLQKTLFTIGLIFYLVNTYAQSKKDSIAIMNLLEKEAATWRAGDIKSHADCWFIRPYSRILISTGDNTVLDLSPAIIINPPANLAGNGGKAIITNAKIGITGKSAWVSHNEESISKEGKSSFTYEIRLLEKIKGQWKLVGQSIHNYKK